MEQTPSKPLLKVRCGFCRGKDSELQTPKRLPCGHIYCLRCLTQDKKYRGAIKCPLCRKFYEGPLESLPLAFHRDDESLLCEDCKKKHSEGTVLDSFCLKCSKLSYAQYKKDLKEQQKNVHKLCERHNLPCLTGCSVCYVLLCEECMKGRELCCDGSQHQQTPINSLIESIDEFCKKLNDKASELRDLFKKLFNESEECPEELVKSEKDEMDRLHHFYDRMEKDFLTNMWRAKQKMHKNAEESFFAKLSEVWSTRMRLEAVTKYGHKPALLTHYAMIKDRVQKILEEEIPPFDVKDFYAEDSSSLTTLSVGNSSELSETNRKGLASNDIADISQLLIDNSVECPEILYDPDNSNRIMIFGKNAGNIPAESRDRLNIVSRDVESPIHTVQMLNSSGFRSIERDADRSFGRKTSSLGQMYPFRSNFFNSNESPNIEDQLKSSKSCSWQRDFSDIGVKTSLGPSYEYLFPMQEPLAIFCAEHSHSWKQLECSECYNHECNQCSIDFEKSHNELIAFMSDIRDKLLAKENLWIQAYKELIEKLAEFDVQNWKCIQELHLEVEMKNKMVKEKYAEMRQWRTAKYDRAIEDFAVNVVGEKLRAVSTLHELLKVRLENSSKADVIEMVAKLRVDAETALNEELPEMKPTDFSTTETDTSSEGIERKFTETESLSSDSIPDFSELLEKHAVENPEISYDPNDGKTILILGKNAGSKLQEDLDALSKGTKFTLTAREAQSSTHTTSMSNSLQITKQIREANDWKGAVFASCEILLHAVCRNKENNEETKEMGYFVGPAHMVLSKLQRKEFASVDNSLEARKEVEKKTTETRFVVEQSPGSHVDLDHPPLMSYKYWCSGRPRGGKQADEQCDCSILKCCENVPCNCNLPACPLCEMPTECEGCIEFDDTFDNINGGLLNTLDFFKAFHEKKMFDDILICGHMILSDMLFLTVDLQTALESYIQLNNSTKRYRSIRTVGDLRKYAHSKQRVKIGEYDGQLTELSMRYKRVQTALNGRHHYFFGLHLVFQLIAKTKHGEPPKLKAGDCGQILYEKKDNKDPLPVGMFIGEFESEPNSYRAVLLQHSIKEIEHIYPHYLGNTELIRDKYARENSYTRQGPRETRSDPSTILPSASDPH